MTTDDDWEPSELKLLKQARNQQDPYGCNAERMQTRFRRLQRLIVWVGVLGAFMVVLQAQIDQPPKGPDAAGTPQILTFLKLDDSNKTVLLKGTHSVIVIIPIILALLVSAATHYRPGEKWILLRVASEETKAEIFKFRTRTGIYSDEAKRAETFAEALAEMIPSDPPTLKYPKKNEKNLIASMLDKMTSLLKKMSKSPKEKTERAGVDSAPTDDDVSPLAAFGHDLWIAVTVAVAGAFSTMLEYEQTDATRAQYSHTVAKLMKVKRVWAGVGFEHRDAGFPKLVSDTEEIFETEHGDFAARIQEALKQLKKQREADESGKRDNHEPGGDS